MSINQKLKAWLDAIRLRTLPLALASIGMGSFMAAGDKQFDWFVFVLCAVTTVLLQILSNLANDYGDSIHGADNIDRKGPKRSVQMGLIKPQEMRIGIILTSLLALTTGILLLLYVFSKISSMLVIFLFIGIGAIFAAMGYTMGRRPYGYTGLGDLFVMIFFGFVGVLGTYFLHTGQLAMIHILPALSSGFFATAVLNVNNIRDIESDETAGKKSIPVRIGREKAVNYHIFLLSGGFLSAILYMIFNYNNMYQFLFLLTFPFFINNISDIKIKTQPDQLDPSLKKLALSILLFTIVFGIGLLI